MELNSFFYLQVYKVVNIRFSTEHFSYFFTKFFKRIYYDYYSISSTWERKKEPTEYQKLDCKQKNILVYAKKSNVATN